MNDLFLLFIFCLLKLAIRGINQDDQCNLIFGENREGISQVKDKILFKFSLNQINLKYILFENYKQKFKIEISKVYNLVDTFVFF